MLLLLLLACSATAPGPSGGGDSGTTGGGDDTAAAGADSGAADSGAGDSGAGDSGTADSGAGDSGTADSGAGDSGAPPEPAATVHITELMADNRDTIELAEGSPDWIELYNPGAEPVSLAGWTLSDTADVGGALLPDLTLAPGGFVVLYATGDAGTASDGRVTLPLKLDADGEQLWLRDPAGTLVDTVTWETQRPDVSWGRPQTVAERVLLDDGDTAVLVAGSPDGWSDPGLDTTAWTDVLLPVGFDDSADDPENLALFAAATQSTDWSSAYPADHAVDGEGSTFTHTATGDFSPWWQVDLGTAGTITDIALTNRLGCCPERLYNVTVSVLDEGGAELWRSDVLNPVAADETPTDPGDRLDAGLTGTVRGRIVRVAKEAVGGTYESEWLSLGEVEVMGRWSAPYAEWIATDIGAALAEGAGEVSLRVAVAALDVAPDRLALEVRADDAFEARWDGGTVASENLDTLEDREVDGAAVFDLSPALAATGGVLAVRLLDAGGDDALLGLRLVAQDIDTDLGDAGFFPEPTPGAPNGTGLPGFVEAPVADPPRGWLDGPITVTLASPTEDSTLVYTLDGSVPTLDHGTVVPSGTTTLDVADTTLLRAAAFRDGWGDSPVATHTFLSMDDVLGQPGAPEGLPTTWEAVSQPAIAGDYEMDPDVVDDPAYADDIVTGLRAIPVLSLVLPHDDLWDADTGIYINSTERGDGWERATSMELIEPDGSSFQGDCGLRIHGYGWRPHSNTKKHSFRLEFRRDYGESRLEYPLFPDAPVDRFDSIVLRAQGSRGWQDFRDPEQALYVRDAFARDTALAMGKEDGHAAYVHLFLNGLYWGLYMAVERPDADFGAERFGGDADEYDAINRRTTTNEAIDGTLEAYETLLALSDEDLTDPAAYDAVAALIDVDDLIDYMLIHQYTANRDGPELYSHNNMRGVRRRLDGERFRFFVWDMEYSLWNATDDINVDVDVAGSASHVYARLRDSETFRSRYAERARMHLGDGGALSADEALARFDSRLAEIEDAVVAESARWGDTDRELPYTRDAEWEEERRRLREAFFPERTDVLIEQLQAAGLY